MVLNLNLSILIGPISKIMKSNSFDFKCKSIILRKRSYFSFPALLIDIIQKASSEIFNQICCAVFDFLCMYIHIIYLLIIAFMCMYKFIYARGKHNKDYIYICMHIFILYIIYTIRITYIYIHIYIYTLSILSTYIKCSVNNFGKDLPESYCEKV